VAADVSDGCLKRLLHFLGHVGDQWAAGESEIVLSERVGPGLAIGAAENVVFAPFFRLKAAQVGEAIHVRAVQENDEARAFLGIVSFRHSQKVAHAFAGRFEKARGAGLYLGGGIDLGRLVVLGCNGRGREEEGERRCRDESADGTNPFSELEVHG
jgi:hypothetical protein